MKDLISNLISTANDTYNGRFHLQHLTAEEKPPKGIYHLISNLLRRERWKKIIVN